MEIFKDILYQVPEYKTLVSWLTKDRFSFIVTGLSEIHKAHILSTLCKNKEIKKAVVVTATENEAFEISDDLSSFGVNACVFCIRDFCFRDLEKESREYEYARLKTLAKVTGGEYDVLLVPIEAAIFHTIPLDVFKTHYFTLKKGQEITIDEIRKRLVDNGYEQFDTVDGAGQFSVRGGILDFFSSDADNPVRIEFFGDEIESIAEFDKVTQRRLNFLEKTVFIPSREVFMSEFTDKDILIDKLKSLADSLKGKNSKAYDILSEEIDKLSLGMEISSMDKFIDFIYPQKSLIFDYIHEDIPIFLSEEAKLKEVLKAVTARWKEELEGYFLDGTLFKELGNGYMEDECSLENIFLKRQIICMNLFSGKSNGFVSKDISKNNILDFNAKSFPPWRGDIETLANELKSITDSGESALVVSGNEKFAGLLSEDLKSFDINVRFSKNCTQISKKEIVVTSGSLSNGFKYENSPILVISYGKYKAKKKTREKVKGKIKDKVKTKIFDLSDLKEGSYVVHSEHGIGLFLGIHRIDMNGIVKDYIKIAYDKNDILYVPVTQMDMVSKYIGTKEDVKLKLNKLGGTSWTKTKKRVKSAVKDIAKELMKLYAERMNAPGFAFSEDDEFQKNFDSRFEYEETEDQLRSIDEIKRDMQKKAPMDRLLCGDVGFGKTEVALRAAFKCLENGKQCAMLVPTTVLAWQHYHTALKRFEGFHFNIQLLSRFRTAKQQNEVIKGIKNGSVEFVIGTHRLIQKDVVFKDLGLAIIDEEQRFGVAHKEKFKALAKNVDILTLSATPIPRTLNMAMSGIRDMSTLNESPQDRFPVQTYVMEYSKGVIFEAIRKEIRRSGQVYYLHNRVESIQNTASEIEREIPEAIVGVAHGQMSEKELSDVWEMLIEKKINVLVCTTIIETGVDVPNVNTLIIENADCMGLSQLHQLRGRVGRSSKRAYAYFTFRRNKALSEVSQKRLSAIKDFTEFGSGFKIAMRDLELRGAGNIIGAQQHGNMEAVGYDMYIKLLEEAIKKEKGEDSVESELECLIDIEASAYIPEGYISSFGERLSMYRRISDIRTEESVKDIVNELKDRFGNIPAETVNLINIAYIRSLASNLGICEIKQRNRVIFIYQKEFDFKKISCIINQMKGKAVLDSGVKPHLLIKVENNERAIDLLNKAFYVERIVE